MSEAGREAGRGTMRGPVLAGLAAIAALLAGLTFWAALVPLPDAVVAAGVVEVDRQRLALAHPDGGPVAEVPVREGEMVAAGQVLLRLDGARPAAELATVERQLSELAARMARLEAERDGAGALVPPPAAEAGVLAVQRVLFDARRAAEAREAAELAVRIGFIAVRIAAIDRQAAASARQAALVAGETARQEDLAARGLGDRRRLDALRREAARLDGEREGLAAARAAAGEAEAAAAAALGRLRNVRRDEAAAALGELERVRIELEGRRDVLRARLAGLEIRAPVAGIVHGLRISAAGAVLAPGETALGLVPLDRPVIVAAAIRPADIRRLHPGQRAELRLPGATLAEPGLPAEVALVSADAFADGEGQGFYRVELHLSPSAPGPPLRPGLPVEVFIRTGDRTALDRLLAPLAADLRRALRQG